MLEPLGPDRERLSTISAPLPASTAASATAARPTRHVPTPPNPPTRVAPPATADPLIPQAQALVAAFYQRFHGLTQVTASPKELAHARQLLREHAVLPTGVLDFSSRFR